MAIQQVGIFSHRKLVGYYRYADLFQILPLEITNSDLKMDFPLILEIDYCPEFFIGGKKALWYRDIWEAERLRVIQNKSGKRVNFSEPWGNFFEKETKRLRPRAVGEEVIHLLTLFTNHRFFSYGSEPHWFLSFDEHTNEDKQHWGELGYLFPTKVKDKLLSNVASYTEVNRVPVGEYRKKERDIIDISIKNEIMLPENIDRLFGLYFSLSDESKKIFYTACKFYNQALELKSTHPSLSLVASVTAIEALIENSEGRNCSECGAKPSIDRCKSCGLPRHQISSRFKQFFHTYGGDSELLNKFARDFYSFRSSVAHGGLLRDDLNDSGFYAGNNDEQQEFRRNSLEIVPKIIVNWLVQKDITNTS
jgi:hypothetical protein